MTAFQPADNLRSRTFLGLLVAQFLAAFNDQAIHASAMFFAINTETMRAGFAITLMPVLFYAPWAIFCTLAGYYADRYSKRTSMVLWKFVEVGITLLALAGFWVGRAGQPGLGAGLVLSTVFLMGMHSAFFVPAKYGAMPEIFTPRMLSRGNGVLESLSFLAVILGTVCGGILSTEFRDREYLIGIVLTALAVVGALASLLIGRIPPANPSRRFPPYVYQPLAQNIRLLLSSRPLVFAVIGIAFFTFLVAFMRATVYMHGQSQLPQWTESKTSVVAGMVALGIGIGSPLVGYLSGGKVEVGLVPVGALGMVVATSVAAFTLPTIPLLVVCIVLIGFFTGFYLVPLFTLLQHRAPKTSKGDSIATSNFINIIGAIAASVVFYGIEFAAVQTGFTPPLPEGHDVMRGTLESVRREHGRSAAVTIDGRTTARDEKGPDFTVLRLSNRARVGDEVVLRTYRLGNVTYARVRPAGEKPEVRYNKERLPALLFLGASGLTLFTLLLLWLQLPDLFTRTRLWLAGLFCYKMEVGGMLHLPANGPALIVTDAADARECDRVLCATDRVTHFLLGAGGDFPALFQQGKRLLLKNGVVGVSLTPAPAGAGARLLDELQAAAPAPLLPVHYATTGRPGKRPRVYVLAGELLPPGAPAEAARAELRRLRDDLARRQAGEPPAAEE
jgi:MFS family permease